MALGHSNHVTRTLARLMGLGYPCERLTCNIRVEFPGQTGSKTR